MLSPQSSAAPMNLWVSRIQPLETATSQTAVPNLRLTANGIALREQLTVCETLQVWPNLKPSSIHGRPVE